MRVEWRAPARMEMIMETLSIWRFRLMWIGMTSKVSFPLTGSVTENKISRKLEGALKNPWGERRSRVYICAEKICWVEYIGERVMVLSLSPSVSLFPVRGVFPPAVGAPTPGDTRHLPPANLDIPWLTAHISFSVYCWYFETASDWYHLLESLNKQESRRQPQIRYRPLPNVRKSREKRNRQDGSKCRAGFVTIPCAPRVQRLPHSPSSIATTLLAKAQRMLLCQERNFSSGSKRWKIQQGSSHHQLEVFTSI